MQNGHRCLKNRENILITLYLLITSLSFFLSQAWAQENSVPFDVLHYDVALTVPMTNEDLSGTSAITLRLTARTDSVMLNALALTIDSVRADGAPASFLLVPASEALVVYLGTGHPAGDTVQLRIVYRRLAATPRPSGRNGYYYYPAGTTNGISPALGYTMSEPSDARAWLPCYDDPSDKATETMAITVPSAFVAGSNGHLVSVIDNGNGTRTWRWREDHQIATYLMCATISEFAVPTEQFVRAVGDTIPVQYFVWPTDSARAAQYLPTVRNMIAAFSNRYGPYPFDKYAMSAMTPFGFGGMEHQTFTTLARNDMDVPAVVSHELAHQWWGDLVTCATWKDIWLNESFASYSEAIWDESLGGQASLRASMLRRLHLGSSSWRSAVYDPEGQGVYLFADLLYSKGAWVLHTLRGVAGDSVFFGALAAYRQKFAGRSATTADLQAVFDSVAGRPMGWFFDQWIRGRGWPEYGFGHSWDSDTLRLLLQQQQDVTWPTFRMPLRVRAWRGGTDTLFVINDSLRTQRFVIPFGPAPDSVKLDPDDWVLKQVTEVTAVDEPSEVPVSWELGQNFPNPFNPVTTINYTIGQGEGGWNVLVQLSVYDILGRQVAVLVNGRQVPGRYEVRFDGSRLASGVYMDRLQAGQWSETRKMVLEK